MNAKRTKTWVIGVIFLIPAYFLSCEWQDLPYDIPEPFFSPNEQVLDAFASLYPQAADVAWRVEGDYYVADFTLSSLEANAWFDSEGVWFLGERDFPVEQVHYEIWETFFNSRFAAWHIVDVNILERKDMGIVYMLSVSDKEAQEGYANLYYSKFGNLIRVCRMENDIRYPVVIPRRIDQTLDRMLGDPEIIDLWIGEWSTNVAVMDGPTYQMLAFTSEYDWICSFWDINSENTPAQVREAYYSSVYKIYPVDYIRLLQSEQGFSYLFYFTDDKKKHHIAFIKENGILSSVLTY